MIEILSMPEIMAILGLLTHVLKDLLRVRSEGGRFANISIVRYVTAYSIQTVLAVIGAVVGIVALHEIGKLDALNAFGVGYMCNSLADIVGKRTVEGLSK